MSALDKAWSLLKNQKDSHPNFNPYPTPVIKPNTMQYPQQPPIETIPCPHCSGSGVTQKPPIQYGPYTQNPNRTAPIPESVDYMNISR